MDQLKNAGFNVPEVLQNVPATNVGKKKRHYDQIAFQIADQRLTYLNGGVFDFYNHVFTADDEKKYAKAMGGALPHFCKRQVAYRLAEINLL